MSFEFGHTLKHVCEDAFHVFYSPICVTVSLSILLSLIKMVKPALVDNINDEEVHWAKVHLQRDT